MDEDAYEELCSLYWDPRNNGNSTSQQLEGSLSSSGSAVTKSGAQGLSISSMFADADANNFQVAK